MTVTACDEPLKVSATTVDSRTVVFVTSAARATIRLFVCLHALPSLVMASAPWYSLLVAGVATVVLSVICIEQAREISLLVNERDSMHRRLAESTTGGKCDSAPIRTCKICASPTHRLPWSAAKREKALSALTRRETELRQYFQQSHKAICVDGPHPTPRICASSHVPNISLAPYGSTLVQVNGRNLAVDDILYGYEHWAENIGIGMHSTTTFQGIALQQDPLDSFAIADLLWRVRPRLLIELGTSGGGSTLFFAKIMASYDPQAHVLTFDPSDKNRGQSLMASVPLRNWNYRGIESFCSHCTPAKDDPIWRHHVTFVADFPTSDSSLKKAEDYANATLAAGLPVLVMDDSNHKLQVVKANLRAYARFVTKGSYFIVQDTRMGRFEGTRIAIEEFLAAQHSASSPTPKFVRDRRPEFYLYSQHSGGFLHRTE